MLIINMESSKTFGIKIHGIELIEKHLFRLVAGININEQLFDLVIQGTVDKANKLIIYFVTGTIRPKSDDQIELGRITIACGYYIDNFEEAVISNTDDGKFTIDGNLDLTLRSLSISTLRGVVFSEFRGTVLHKVFLPIIDATKLQPPNDKPI